MRRKLQEEHDLLRTVIDSLPDYIYTKDLDGRYTRVNAAQLRILGAATIEAVIGKTDHDLFPEYLAEQIQREEQEILQSGQPLINREESIIDRSSGRRRWVLTSKAPVRDDSGQNIRIVGIIRDITDSKRAEEKRLEAERLQIKLEKEKEVLDLKEQFLSVVSHEFRTPLAVIKSAVDLLQRYFDRLSPEKHQKYIQNIATRTDEMIELLNDVLIISKARASKTEFKLEPIDLEGFCSDIVEQLQGTQGASHRLVFTSRGQFENGHFDTRLLRHILINLLSNAIKYSPTGSDVLFDLTRENDRAIFLVKDRGIGIPSHDLEQLYEPFFRATNTGSIGGTGLGLAIVYESVMTHGGTIACESTEGEGATFTIHLPIVSSPDQHDDD
jgi:PAS domain S-box-containing protein